jgi:hypothetical protein
MTARRWGADVSIYATAPSATQVRSHVALGRVVTLGAVTTYYYRTTGGTRGSTTSVGAIPGGAIVERVVTA